MHTHTCACCPVVTALSVATGQPRATLELRFPPLLVPVFQPWVTDRLSAAVAHGYGDAPLHTEGA